MSIRLVSYVSILSALALAGCSSIAFTARGEPRVGYQIRDVSGGLDNPDPTKPDCEAGTDMTWSRLARMGAE
jgi:hypothetical protein